MSDPFRPSESAAPSELDQLPDRDAEETAEWRASLDAVVRNAGPDRAVYLLRRVHEHAARSGLAVPGLLTTDPVNTVPAWAQPDFPGDLALESRAVEHRGAPTVVLVQTVKGHTLGPEFASRNANHQMKKLSTEQFRELRDRLELPIPDRALDGDETPF